MATRSVGALAGAVVAGTALVGGVSVSPLPAASPQQGIALVSFEAAGTPFNPFDPIPGVQNSLATSLKFLLDNVLGVGQQPLDQLLGGNGATIGDLLGGANITTSFGIAPLMDALGMNNITIGDLMADFGLYNATTPITVDDLMNTWGLGGWTLDHLLLATVGLSHTSTLGDLAVDMSIAGDTIDELFTKLGMSGSETLGQVLTALHQNNTITTGALTALGWTSGTTLDQVVASLGQCGINPVCLLAVGGTSGTEVTGSDSLEFALKAWHVPNTDGTFNFSGQALWDYTLGQAAGFDQNTTVNGFLDTLMVNPPGGNHDPSQLVPLGGMDTGSLLQWIGLGPNTTIADLVDNFVVKSQPLGSYTIGDALDGLITNSSLLPDGVSDSTSVATFLDATGWGTMSLDQFLGLG